MVAHKRDVGRKYPRQKWGVIFEEANEVKLSNLFPDSSYAIRLTIEDNRSWMASRVHLMTHEDHRGMPRPLML